MASQDTGSAGFSWFPGHMHKAQERLKRELPKVDLILEVRDARVPLLSGNSELQAIFGQKPRLVLLNKSALADPAESHRWSQKFDAQGISHLFLDADSQKGVNLIYPALRSLLAGRGATLKKRGIRPPLYKLLVLGMPNVGKTTIINRLSGRSRLRTAPEPGVTRSITWLTLRNRYLLADSPGIMLPRLPDLRTAFILGWIGAIRDSVAGELRVAESLIEYFTTIDRKAVLMAAYGLEDSAFDSPQLALDGIARKRSMLSKGEQPDRLRAARLVLSDFRGGVLGRVTLESCS